MGPINRGALDKLRSVVQESIKINELSPERAEAYYIRGLAKNKNGDSKGAIADLNSSIALNPTFAEAYFTRGLVHSSIGAQMEAILDCSSAIKINPKYSEAYYVRGIIKHSLGDVNGGCLDLSKSGELGYTPAYKVISDYCN
jgi:tetratricopeptide (TPR) repeat protein